MVDGRPIKSGRRASKKEYGWANEKASEQSDKAGGRANGGRTGGRRGVTRTQVNGRIRPVDGRTCGRTGKAD